jgi:putative endonuclease
MSTLKGRCGEDVAVSFLKSKQYRILAQNFYSKMGEIDIVAMSPDAILVFVEVKFYQANNLVSPYEAVSPSKLKKIRKTAEFYCLKHRIVDQMMRLDLLVVKEGVVVDHLENIF